MNNLKNVLLVLAVRSEAAMAKDLIFLTASFKLLLNRFIIETKFTINTSTQIINKKIRINTSFHHYMLFIYEILI